MALFGDALVVAWVVSMLTWLTDSTVRAIVSVLVELTRQLAEHGAVPVNIRLRDAQDGLDFGEMAKSRLLSHVDNALMTQADGDRIWRQLRRDNRIVVLADGLEEALLTGADRRPVPSPLMPSRQASSRRVSRRP